MAMRHTVTRVVRGALVLVVLLAWAVPATATIRFGNLMLFGDLESQNLFRMRKPGKFQPVQQRNQLRLGFEYPLIKRGKLDKAMPGGGTKVPWVKNVTLYGMYRGAWDSVYTFGPNDRLYDFTGARGRSIGSLDSDSRKNLEFPESGMREAYVDIDLKDAPISFRIGRQQIVWGETDNFRLLDRINALDLTWHLQQEIELQRGWDRIRIPYWMIKGLWKLGKVGPVSDSFLEAYWNPGDWYPNKRGFLPFYPWSVPLEDPLAAFPGGLMNGTRLFRNGDYSRNPGDNSQAGIRFAGFAGGVNFSVAYIWQRLNGDDGANSAFLRAEMDPAAAGAALGQQQLPAEYYTPYVHTVGFSANYFEEWSELVLKTEMVYVFGVPFQDGDKRSPVLPAQLFDVSKRDMWQGMIGFDRPTWIRWLNPRATWLILGQFFWHHIIDNERTTGDQIGFVGNLSPLTPLTIGGRPGGQACAGGPNCRPVDKVRDWEALVTLAATSFYMSGSLIPQLTYVLDPVNKFNMEFHWSLDYYVTPNFVVNVAQKYFVNTTDEPVYETWGVAGINRGRSETQFRLTYLF